MRCAAAGEWGATVPEFLDWYRRRPNHNDRWREWDGGERQKRFVESFRQRYPTVTAGRFPDVAEPPPPANAVLALDPPDVNRLDKTKRRLLMIVPWCAMGGSDKFNLDVVENLQGRNWEVTVATTSSDSTWLSLFERLTPDVFVMPAFLETADQPRFLRYLIATRQPDVILLSHSELGYHLLPFLRAHAPAVTADGAGIAAPTSLVAWGHGYPRTPSPASGARARRLPRRARPAGHRHRCGPRRP